MPADASALSGVFALRKPAGKTSTKVLNDFKRRAGLPRRAKVGHGGTLDPLATGVLVVGVGRGTKALRHLLAGRKEYVATAFFGAETDTLDRTGAVTATGADAAGSEGALRAALAQFRGRISQVPPMYSALRHGGQRLHELARAGVQVAIQPREVTIYALELAEFSEAAEEAGQSRAPLSEEAAAAQSPATPARSAEDAASAAPETQPQPLPTRTKFVLRIECSGGTYVRALIRDIARELGTCAYMAELERTRQSVFGVEDALELGDISARDCARLDRALKDGARRMDEYIADKEEAQAIAAANPAIFGGVKDEERQQEE